jgi:signal transduction histidine kinase
MGCYEFYRESGDVSELQGARFRKALERTYAFMKKTQILMEESRFLLSDITKASLRLGAHSIPSLVRDVVRAVSPAAERRDLHIHIDQHLSKELEMAHMDRGLIYMLSFNLLENAVKYSFRGRDILIRASIERENWVLRIRNYGVYIRPEDRDMIFMPFRRRPTGQAATTRPGTGLGLAVAKRIAESHGGSIDVESKIIDESSSEPVAETCFTVTLPRRIHMKEDK